MAPQIARKKGRDRTPEPVAAETQAATTPEASATPETAPQPISTPLLMAQERELRAKLKQLRDHITKTADNVGDQFPERSPQDALRRDRSTARSTARPPPRKPAR